jgi:RNA polymerase sigma-70 factor (ECF subfamily)
MIIHQYNDNDLWIKVCQGDIGSFQLIFKNHYKPLCIHAFVIVKDDEIAQDVVQDVFLKVWNKKEELFQISNIISYLYTAVRNAALDYLRKFKTTEDINELEIGDQALDPYQAINIKELGNHLKESVANLPLQCRLIFEMVYIEGRKYQEVADELGLSINTIKTQLKRALVKMRLAMEKFR